MKGTLGALHEVTLGAYYIYKTTVTVAEYTRYCAATGAPMPAAPSFDRGWDLKTHPIVNVSWDDAQSYCKWAGVQLPTGEQWEKAARGTDGRIFPWGNDWDPTKLWCSKQEMADAHGTTEVGQFTDSPYHLSDMVGNVWQWCAGSDNQSYQIRGGSLVYPVPEMFHVAGEFSYPTGEGHPDVGFRCVALASAPAADSNEFNKAVQLGRTDDVERMLKQDPTLITSRYYGLTPLGWAAIQGLTKMVTLLLAHGADVNERSDSGETPLYLAAENGYPAVVEILLDRQADVNLASNLGLTPLHAAVFLGHPDVAAILLKHGAKVNDIFVAAGVGDVAKVKALLADHPDAIASRGPQGGETPLGVAAMNGRQAVVEVLLAAKADVNAAKNLNIANRDPGETPLHEACAYGYAAIVQSLLDHGAEVNAQDGLYSTPLHYAAEGGRKDIVALLLAHGADVNPTDKDHWTPLHLAAANDHWDVVALLRRHGGVDQVQSGTSPAAPAGGELNTPAIMRGDDTLVPLRELGEWVGAVVDWNPPHILLTKEALKVELTMDGATATVTDTQGSRNLTLALAPQVINDTTYVPLRFVAEALGVTVDYQAANHVVVLAIGDKTATLAVTGAPGSEPSHAPSAEGHSLEEIAANPAAYGFVSGAQTETNFTEAGRAEGYKDYTDTSWTKHNSDGTTTTILVSTENDNGKVLRVQQTDRPNEVNPYGP
jgi:ankyrin repeat protein